MSVIWAEGRFKQRTSNIDETESINHSNSTQEPSIVTSPINNITPKKGRMVIKWMNMYPQGILVDMTGVNLPDPFPPDFEPPPPKLAA